MRLEFIALALAVITLMASCSPPPAGHVQAHQHGEVKGQHGGKVLSQDDFALEASAQILLLRGIWHVGFRYLEQLDVQQHILGGCWSIWLRINVFLVLIVLLVFFKIHYNK